MTTTTSGSAFGFSQPQAPRQKSITPTALAMGKLRFVATDNKVGHSEFDVLGGGDSVIDYFPVVIGSGDVSSITVSLSSFFVTGSNDVAASNDYVFTGSLQMAPNLVVPITKAGLPTFTIAAGSVDVHCDAILPSAFGLTVFPKGAVLAYVGNRRHSGSSRKCIENGFATGYGGGAAPMTGPAVSAHYTLANNNGFDPHAFGSPNPVNGATGVSLFGEGYRPDVLGTFVTGDPIVLGGLADSITDVGGALVVSTEFNGTAAGGNPNGGSWAWRAAQAASAGPLAFGNMAKAAGSLTGDVTKRSMFWQYANTWAILEGANGLGAGLANEQNALISIWAAMRAAGVVRIAEAAIVPRTNSSNGFVDATNQTYQTSQYQPGGDMDTFNNTFLPSKLADGSIDRVIALNTIRDPGNAFKWRSPGYAQDGTHPTSGIGSTTAGSPGLGSATMAVELTAWLNTLN